MVVVGVFFKLQGSLQFCSVGVEGTGGGGGGAGTDISHLFVKHGTTVSRTGVSGP